MRTLFKARRVLSLVLALITVFCLAIPAMADANGISFDGYVGETDTHDIVTIGTTDISITEIRISNKKNCGILSTLKCGYAERNGKIVLTLTVGASSPGTAYFTYSYAYIQNGHTISNDFRVTMNITGPTPEPDMPVVSISASEQKAKTGVSTLTANFSGCSKYTYQWYYNTKNSTSGAVPVGGSETTSSDKVTIKASFDGKTEPYYYWFIKVQNAKGGTAVYSKSVRLYNPYSPEFVTPTPTPKAGKDLPEITKNPSGETVTEGSSTSFIARADDCDEYEWTFVNPSGREYTPAEAKKKLSGLKYSGETTEKLKLSNIPYAMDGWSVYCTFTNENGSIDSKKAYITVDEEYGDDEDDAPVRTRVPSTPTPTPYSITPVPYYVSSTPLPTATPHTHSYPTTYRYDSNYHWRECECGDTTDIGTHTFDDSGMCYVCGYQDTTKGTGGTTGGTTKKSDPFGKIMLILGILFAVAVGVLVFVLIREKKRKERLRRAAAAMRRRQAQAGEAARRASHRSNDDDDDDDDDNSPDDSNGKDSGDGNAPFNLFD